MGNSNVTRAGYAYLLKLLNFDTELTPQDKCDVISDFVEILPEDHLDDFFENYFKRFLSDCAGVPIREKEESSYTQKTEDGKSVKIVYQGIDVLF